MRAADLRRQGPHGSDYGCQYLSLDSPIHRMGVGWKLFLGSLLGVAAIAAQHPWSLALVLALDALYYFSARLSLSDLWRDTRYLTVQALIIVGLYAARYGVPQGIWPGLRIALQIFLFFIPGIVFLRTTQATRMMRELSRVIPYRLSFLVYTSLRFVPIFAREVREIRLAQQLRGARLEARNLLNPLTWRDTFHCLMIPLLVRALKIADESALSAEARGFGLKSERSYFNPSTLESSEAENDRQPDLT